MSDFVAHGIPQVLAGLTGREDDSWFGSWNDGSRLCSDSLGDDQVRRFFNLKS